MNAITNPANRNKLFILAGVVAAAVFLFIFLSRRDDSVHARASTNNSQLSTALTKVKFDQHIHARLLGEIKEPISKKDILKIADRVFEHQLSFANNYPKFWEGRGMDGNAHAYQNVFNPTVECNFKARIGITYHDGGKWTCDPHKLRLLPKQCRVYSFGSFGDTAFDSVMDDVFGCEVHTFDPTTQESVKQQLTPNNKFHFIGLGPSDVGKSVWTMNGNMQLKSIGQITKEFGHDHLDVLKMDVEGAEIGALPYLLNEEIETFRKLKIKIIQLEDHKCCGQATFMDYWLPLNKKLHEEGYYMYSAEINSAGVFMVEYAWVHKDFFLLGSEFK